ncbi:MAG: DNA topoisomerase VI subunit B [Candidatus Iainarchaeum archaeon]|uniref:Type 2 DNA topoisomerase 6 subunit B n=1 Tax=Candidatus Iainarchaeum sp. TaxID=3101447 RepID=A0A497JHT1_9ARCH|nr:MAG: DNA topoisomerase VI subunit B [Candidatus Diapherotrites archaeon]
MAREFEREITAKELEQHFKEHSVAEFFKKNMQMLGLTGKIRTLTTIIHEYVTNSIDACEDARILPEIEVRISELAPFYYEVMVKDNGPGLTKTTVGKALGKLLAGTKFHRLIQSRGQQGIGAAGVTMLSQITTGQPIKVLTGNGKETFACEISIDVRKNEPKIANMQDLKKEFRGLLIKARFKDVKYVKGEQGPAEYLRRTAIANPHVTIKFIDPNKEKFVFKRTVQQIPAKPKEVKPHPKGVTVDELITLAKHTKAKKVVSFLKNDFDRMGEKAIQEISKLVSFDLNKDPAQLRWHEAEELVKAFKKVNFLAPRTDALRPIGKERIEKAMKSIVEPEFIAVVTRNPQVYRGGFPFQVEVAIAYGGKAGKIINGQKKIEIMRFANRVPLLFDAGGCAITKAVNSIDWRRYNIKDIENTPLTIFVNLISVFVPYTSAGKQAIADEEEIMEELRLALMDCGRRISKYIAGKQREYERKMKKETFFKYIPEVAEALHKVTKENSEMLKKRLERLVLERLKLEEKEVDDNEKKGKTAEES